MSYSYNLDPIPKVQFDDAYSRQAFMFSTQTRNIPIFIIGCGFVGSNLAYTLAKSSFKHLFLIDNDIIQTHNLGNQCFLAKDEGKSKVEGVKNYIETNLQLLHYPLVFPHKTTLEELYSKSSTSLLTHKKIFILATDNLESRIFFLKEVIENYDKIDKDTLFVFANTSSEMIYLAFVQNDLNFLKNALAELESLTLDDITEGICGEKSSFFLGNLISGLVVNEIRKIYKDKEEKNITSYSKEYAYLPKECEFIPNFSWLGKKKKVKK